MQIADKTVVVTGGLGSLGSSVVNALREKGANVIIFDIRDDEAQNAYKVDLSDENELVSVLEKIDKIDVLINCVGEIYSEPAINPMKMQAHGVDSWNRVINNNLNTCFMTSTRIAQKMARDRVKGVIINFSSISAAGNAGQIAYSAAKAGIEALTKALAKELGMFKIRVCALAPGFIETESTKNSLSESMLDYWKKETPLRRLGKVEDITRTIE